MRAFNRTPCRSYKCHIYMLDRKSAELLRGDLVRLRCPDKFGKFFWLEESSECVMKTGNIPQLTGKTVNTTHCKGRFKAGWEKMTLDDEIVVLWGTRGIYARCWRKIHPRETAMLCVHSDRRTQRTHPR